MIISLIISGLLGIIIILLGNNGVIESKVLLTTLSFGVYSLSALCCSLLYEKKRAIFIAISGIIVSVIGFLYSCFMIWEIISFTSWNGFKILILFGILAFSLAHSSLLLLIKAKKSLTFYFLYSTIGFIWITALMLVILICSISIPGEYYFRLLGVFIILDVLGTIVVPIMNKIHSKQE